MEFGRSWSGGGVNNVVIIDIGNCWFGEGGNWGCTTRSTVFSKDVSDLSNVPGLDGGFSHVFVRIVGKVEDCGSLSYGRELKNSVHDRARGMRGEGSKS